MLNVERTDKEFEVQTLEEIVIYARGRPMRPPMYEPAAEARNRATKPPPLPPLLGAIFTFLLGCCRSSCNGLASELMA